MNKHIFDEKFIIAFACTRNKTRSTCDSLKIKLANDRPQGERIKLSAE